MKAPKWGYVVGAILVVLGIVFIINSIAKISANDDLNEHPATTHTIKSTNATSSSSSFNIQQASMAAEQGITSIEGKHSLNWWLKRFGYAGAVFGLLYIFAGAFMIKIKEFSLKLVFMVLSGSLLFGIIQVVILFNQTDQSIVTLLFQSLPGISILLNLGLLAAVGFADKEVYLEKMNAAMED